MGTVFITAARSDYLKKQILGLIICFIIMIIVSFIDYDVISRYWGVLYIINLVALVLVKLVGLTLNGATRWFELPFGLGTFQPSEITKIIMIICVAVYIEKHEEDLNTAKTLFKLALLCALPIGLIMIQTDLSTSLAIMLILLAMIFVGGLSYRIILSSIAVVVPLLFLLIKYIQSPGQKLLRGNRLTRILAFIEPDKYAKTAAYQQENSIMAIGSGKLYGKGLYSDSLATVKDANLVSEQQTDFIFSIVGEMLGFVGCILVISFLALYVIQCIGIARKAKNTSGMLIATGIASLVAFQSFMNIGVATGLLPNTGLPLPFISYGLSSLMGMSIATGLILNIGLQRRKY